MAHALPRRDRPIQDASGKVWALILRRPGRNWDERIGRIQAKFDSGLAQLQHLAHPLNRRGDFIAYNAGYSYGRGQTVPTNVRIPSAAARTVLSDLLEDADVNGLIGYTEGMLFLPFLL